MNESGGLGYEYQDDTLPYRKLMCAMILWNAIAYLLSDDFEFDMELLGLDEMIKSVRKYVFDDINKTKSKIKIENEEK